MKKVLKIDNEGYFLYEVLLEDNETIPSDCIELIYINGLFDKPKWDGTQWIEGLTQVEIDAIKNQPIQPSQLELLQKAVDDLILGGV